MLWVAASVNVEVVRSKQGALRMLFTAMETVLTELGVKQILVPSIRRLKRMWCEKFGFVRMTLDEVAKVEDWIVYPDAETCILLRKLLGQQTAELRVPVCQKTNQDNKKRKVFTASSFYCSMIMVKWRQRFSSGTAGNRCSTEKKCGCQGTKGNWRDINEKRGEHV
jgi:hypothetical protein